MQPCGWNYPRVEGQGAKKEVCIAHRILVFHLLFFFSWFYMMSFCHPYNLNMKFLLFFKTFTRSWVLKFWVKTPINKRNLSSFISINVELRFEPCMLNLILKYCAKDPKKGEDHLIFINFGIKKFTVRNTPQKKTLMCECYYLLGHMEWRAVIFWGWCPTR
jgi:hypothetical protein